MNVVHEFDEEGGFTCADLDTGFTAYAYPTSLHAEKARRQGQLVAGEMMEQENAHRALVRDWAQTTFNLFVDTKGRSFQLSVWDDWVLTDVRRLAMLQSRSLAEEIARNERLLALQSEQIARNNELIAQNDRALRNSKR